MKREHAINYLRSSGMTEEQIDEVTAAFEQRWIPVSERLPEERDWYLAVFKESDTGFQLIPRVADYIGMGENKWQLMDENGLASEYRDLLECIAWMPLPEPYQAESNLDGDLIDIDKAVEHYEGTLEVLKGIDLEVDG